MLNPGFFHHYIERQRAAGALVLQPRMGFSGHAQMRSGLEAVAGVNAPTIGTITVDSTFKFIEPLLLVVMAVVVGVIVFALFTPLLKLMEKIGEAAPRPLPPAGARPLEGLRVLDLTMVWAGPYGLSNQTKLYCHLNVTPLVGTYPGTGEDLEIIGAFAPD